MITPSRKLDYAVDEIVTGDHIFPTIFFETTNSGCFQLKWDATIAAGEFIVYGTNQLEGSYPPALTKIPLAVIDVSVAPFSTLRAGFLEVTSACAYIWVEYSGVDSGLVSISYNGKSLG